MTKTNYYLENGAKFSIKVKHRGLKGLIHSLFRLNSSNPTIMTVQVSDKKFSVHVGSCFVAGVYFYNTTQKKRVENMPFQENPTWPILEISPGKRTYFYLEDSLSSFYITPGNKIRLHVIGEGSVYGENITAI